MVVLIRRTLIDHVSSLRKFFTLLLNLITLGFRHSYMSVYKSLWRSKSDRIQAEKEGIANENLRKLFSKDNSGANDCDSLMFSIHRTKQNIQLGCLLKDHCLYPPFNIKNNLINIR